MRRKYIFLALLVLALDHATKWLIRSTFLLHESIDVISGYLRISRVHNNGVAFGMFADVRSPWKPYILALMAAIAVVAIGIYARKIPADRALLLSALAVTLGGILGNFIDRIVHGFVVDFVEFHIHESFYWPTFNVADTAISTGIGLLILDTIKNPDKTEELHESANNRSAEK
jgi:signal peptidase II